MNNTSVAEEKETVVGELPKDPVFGILEILKCMTPASVYYNEINFNKNRKYLKGGQKLCQQNGH